MFLRPQNNELKQKIGFDGDKIPTLFPAQFRAQVSKKAYVNGLLEVPLSYLLKNQVGELGE